MFNFFKDETPVYVPKINDTVKHKNVEGLFLVTNVTDESVELTDRHGKVFTGDTCELIQTSHGVRDLSDAQRDLYFNRTPEKILQRKIDQRLKCLVTEDDFRTYCRVDAIRNLIKGDLTK